MPELLNPDPAEGLRDREIRRYFAQGEWLPPLLFVLNLGYASVTAPIAGRISDRKVDAGNLITGGQTGATLTISNAQFAERIARLAPEDPERERERERERGYNFAVGFAEVLLRFC